MGQGSGLEKRPGVQIVVAYEFIGRAVIRVRTPFRDDIDLGPACHAELGIVSVGLNLELLNHIDTGRKVHPRVPGILIVDSIDHRSIRKSGHAVGGYVPAGVDKGTGVRSCVVLNAGRELRQLKKIAAVEWQLQYFLGVDYFPYR